MPQCFVIRGPAGVGKSTLARRLQFLLGRGTKAISVDELREQMFGHGGYFKEHKIAAVKEAVRLARTYLDQGDSVVIDEMCEYAEQIDLITQQLPHAQWITLVAGLDTLIKRDEKRYKPEYAFGYCGRAVIEYLFQNHDHRSVQGEWVIHTEGKTPEDVCKEVQANLQQTKTPAA